MSENTKSLTAEEIKELREAVKSAAAALDARMDFGRKSPAANKLRAVFSALFGKEGVGDGQ